MLQNFNYVGYIHSIAVWIIRSVKIGVNWGREILYELGKFSIIGVQATYQKHLYLVSYTMLYLFNWEENELIFYS